MASNRTITVVIAVIGILILTIGAANIANPGQLGDDGTGLPGFVSDDLDDGDGGIGTDGEQGAFELLLPFGPFCAGFLLETNVQLGLLFILGFIGLGIWRRVGPLISLGIMAGTFPMLYIFYLLLTLGCRQPERPDDASFELADFLQILPVSNESSGQAVEVTTDPVFVLLGIIAIAVIAIVFIALSDELKDAETFLSISSTAEEPVGTDADIAAIAGEFADRLEGPDTDDVGVENEVYRAWVAMTDELDVESPETSTPGEFATAAIEAGLDPEDVEALTGLFESVRYGDRPVTPEREDEAVRVLRRIEESYGANR